MLAKTISICPESNWKMRHKKSVPAAGEIRRNKYPAFLVIGAQRAGTTWLYYHLYKHPEVWLPPIKELHYFDVLDPSVNMKSRKFRKHVRVRVAHNAAKLISYVASIKKVSNKMIRCDLAFDLRYFFRKSSHEWYASLFRKAHEAGRVTGEFTPAYSILSKEYIREVYKINEGMKIIFILRNPIQRSWSHAVKDLCVAKKRSIDDVSESEFIGFFNNPECLSRSDYLTAYENWTSVFPKDQVFICYYEGIALEPKKMLQSVCRFLGVDHRLYDSGQEILGAVNSSVPRDKKIPLKLEYELARIYEPSLRRLSSMFPGFPEKWHHEAIEILKANNAKDSR